MKAKKIHTRLPDKSQEQVNDEVARNVADIREAANALFSAAQAGDAEAEQMFHDLCDQTEKAAAAIKAERRPKHRIQAVADFYAPETRYYNQVADGLKILWELTADGKDLEYVERLRKLAVLAMELAAAPPACPAVVTTGTAPQPIAVRKLDLPF